MKKWLSLSIFAITIAFSTLAFADPAKITKDAKPAGSAKATSLEELNFKYDRLMQLDYARHQEILRQLKEIRALAAKKTTDQAAEPAPSSEAKPAEPVTAPATVTTATAMPTATTTQGPASTPTPATTEEVPPIIPPQIPEETPTPAIQPQAAVVAPAVIVPSEPAAGKETATSADATGRASSSVAAAPVPEPATPTVVAEVPVTTPPPAVVPQTTAPAQEVVVQEMHQSQSLSILAIIVSVISLVSMAVLIITIRKSDERMRRMLWKSEVDHLRDEVMGGRPHLKVEKSYDRLLLTNTGSVIADDIKLSLGPAPATMKQRLRVLAQIAANEKAEVEIGPQPSGGQIYGTLEYKNPDTGRIYKDQFVLKVDSVTGELIPVQQAS